jgi:sugar phosphate isomerase/epimerase
MNPMIALSQLGFPHTTFEQDLMIARAVGVAGISPDEGKLGAGGEADRMLRAGLRAAIGTPTVQTILPMRPPGPPVGPEDPAARIEAIVGAMRALRPFTPDTVLVITGPVGERTPREARAVVVEGLRTLATEAAALDLRIALEPMREDFRDGLTIVSSLPQTLDLLDEVGDDRIGIIFDTWHLWDSDAVYASVPATAPRIHAVQIADYRDPTRAPMDRVAAGDGVAGIDRLVAALRSAGYAGWWDLEIFSDDGRGGFDLPDSLWKLDPADYARRQVDGFLNCWRQ